MAQLPMYSGVVNSPETTITNNIGVSDTIIYVLDPARVPAPPNLMTLGTGTNAETVLVTAVSDNALTVTRGMQGVAKEWLAGTIIARNFTAYDHDTFKHNIEDLDAGKINHSLATAANDFLVASGAGAFVKKTLAQVKTILGLKSAAYTESSAYATAAQGATADDTATALATHLADSASLSALGHVKHGTMTATLTTTWIGSTAPYTQEVTVSGILATDTPIVDIVPSGTYATDKAMEESWANVYRIVTSDNKITAYAHAAPATSIALQLKVVR
jgi:hypothetical protein